MSMICRKSYINLTSLLFHQVLSATLEWSVISMLKDFVFVVIVISAYLTWHSTFLFPKQEKGDTKDKSNDEASSLIATNKNRNKGEVKQKKDPEDTQQTDNIDDAGQNQVQDTCSALGRCLCTLGLCFFTPCTSSCCSFARGENPYSFTFYLANGFWFFWRGFQLRFLTAFGAFSSGLVSLLSAPVQNEDERFFALKSALTAIWVPCVVGDKPHTFLVTALVSRLVRTLALVATLLLYKFKFPAFLQKRTILLFCAPQDTLTSLGLNITSIYPGSECFQFCKNDTTDCLDHRFRSCEDDSFFFVTLISVLAFSSVFSFLATFRLKHLSNYNKLFQVSRTALPCCSPTQDNSSRVRLCYPCCPFEPILHRSVIFDKMAAGNFDDFSDLLIDAPVDALLRPNIQGLTPLHVAAEMNDTRFLGELLTELKLKNRGEDKEEDEEALSKKTSCKDSRGRSPIFNACEKNNLSALELLLEAGFDPDEEDREGWRPIQVAMSNNAKECVLNLLSCSKEVRKRTQAYARSRIFSRVTLSQGGIKMGIFHEEMDSDLIDDIENSESAQVEGSAVTREDHKPVDPVLDGLVESLKKDSDRDWLECDLEGGGGGERRTVGSSATSRCQSKYCGHQ